MPKRSKGNEERAGLDRLPNLKALRAFEIAARKLSFSAAANDLGVTQSAVSHQIRTLEIDLGVSLFHRLTRALELTEEGARYAVEVRDILTQLERATRQFRFHSQRNVLTVNGLPSLAIKYLQPRLHRFSAMHPDVVLRLTMSVAPVDFEHDDIDIAIRVGKPSQSPLSTAEPDYHLAMVKDWTGVRSDVLMRDILVPVCTKKFLQKHGPFRTTADLCVAPLLHNRVDSRRSWLEWFRAFDLPYDSAQFAASYGHFFLAMQAASQGLGVALIPNIYIPSSGARGGLVPLSEFAIDTGQAYYLLYRENRPAADCTRQFHEWLLRERDDGFAQAQPLSPAASQRRRKG